MIDMELFELMKVTLKEVLRAELARRAVSFPALSANDIAAKAYEQALAAKRCLERHRPSEPVNDPHAPTMHPPPRKCENSSCSEVAIEGSDFCGGHQY